MNMPALPIIVQTRSEQNESSMSTTQNIEEMKQFSIMQ